MHAVLQQQLKALAAGDIEAMMENYAPDAALVRFDGVFSGMEGIRNALRTYLSMTPRILKLKQYAEHDDIIFYRALMDIGGHVTEAVGTLVIRDGKIRRQTAEFFGERVS